MTCQGKTVFWDDDPDQALLLVYEKWGFIRSDDGGWIAEMRIFDELDAGQFWDECRAVCPDWSCEMESWDRVAYWDADTPPANNEPPAPLAPDEEECLRDMDQA